MTRMISVSVWNTSCSLTTRGEGLQRDSSAISWWISAEQSTP